MEKKVCIACGTLQPEGWLEEDCFHCGENIAAPEYLLELKDYTPQQRQAVYDQYKKEQEEKAQKERAAKLAKHPINANGELDMSDARNNPLLQKKKEYDVHDMTDSRNNPMLPDSTAKVNFGEEEKKVDYTRPENNPLIPR